MRKCDDCRYRQEPEYNKPCVVYSEDCPLYEKEGEDMTREEAIAFFKDMNECTYGNLEAVEMAIKALEQEPCNTDTCKVVKAYMNEWDKPNNSDAISRQAVLDLLEDTNNGWVINEVLQLPSVNPQEPKTGHWIVWDTSSYDWTYKCDKCGSIEFKQSNYCPNCGAKMIEPQESEE